MTAPKPVCPKCQLLIPTTPVPDEGVWNSAQPWSAAPSHTGSLCIDPTDFPPWRLVGATWRSCSSGCSGRSLSPPVPRSCPGDASHPSPRAKDSPALSEPRRSSADELAHRACGRELFLREWLPMDPRSHGGDGLGPMYNDSSCVACHNLGGPGGGGPIARMWTSLPSSPPSGMAGRHRIVRASRKPSGIPPGEEPRLAPIRDRSGLRGGAANLAGGAERWDFLGRLGGTCRWPGGVGPRDCQGIGAVGHRSPRAGAAVPRMIRSAARGTPPPCSEPGDRRHPRRGHRGG